MKKAYLFLADGFEEVEALVPVDLLRRSGVDVTTVSVTGKRPVTGRSDICVEADALFEDTDFEDADTLILPGGMPGTKTLAAFKPLAKLLFDAYEKDDVILAAICAAPTVLGGLGLLEGVRAVCYPGMEDGLKGAVAGTESVVRDGNIITARGAGCAEAFAFALIEALEGDVTARRVRREIVCPV